MKSFERPIQSPNEIVFKLTDNEHRPAQNATVNSLIEDQKSKNKKCDFFRAKWQKTDDELYHKMKTLVLYCCNSQKLTKKKKNPIQKDI